MFATRGVPIDQAFTFILVNIHTDPDVATEEMDVLAQVYQVVRRSGMGEDDIILLGDLNTNVRLSPTRALTPSDLAGLGQIEGIYPVVPQPADQRGEEQTARQHLVPPPQHHRVHRPPAASTTSSRSTA